MIYTNVSLGVQKKEMKFGTVNGVAIGEYGRGRHEVFLPTPNDLETIPGGLATDLTIGLSKSGRPRINRSADGELYLILSTERGYTRRGNGFVRVPKEQAVEIVARGNGADGDAGRIGTWDALLLKVHEGDVFRLTWAGYNYGYDATFYVVANGEVHVADQPEIEDLYEALNLEIPFSLTFEDDSLKIATSEWTII